MSKITIFGPAPSSYVRTARMTCVEKGVAHSLEPLDLGSDAHRALHPWRRVPVMQHGELRLFETAAICRYIDASFDGPSLVPSSAAAAGVMDQWISVLDCYLYDSMIRNYALQYIFPKGAGGAPDREVIDRAVATFNTELDALDAALAGQEHLAGSFSLAELFYAPVFDTFSKFPEGKQAIESKKNLSGWVERLLGRKSLKEVTPAR